MTTRHSPLPPETIHLLELLDRHLLSAVVELELLLELTNHRDTIRRHLVAMDERLAMLRARCVLVACEAKQRGA